MTAYIFKVDRRIRGARTGLRQPLAFPACPPPPCGSLCVSGYWTQLRLAIEAATNEITNEVCTFRSLGTKGALAVAQIGWFRRNAKRELDVQLLSRLDSEANDDRLSLFPSSPFPLLLLFLSYPICVL